jgi:hypothetical protein
MAYEDILGRKADMNGLRAYNDRMKRGLTEAELREELLRSTEFANKHPLASSALTSTRKK